MRCYWMEQLYGGAADGQRAERPLLHTNTIDQLVAFILVPLDRFNCPYCVRPHIRAVFTYYLFSCRALAALCERSVAFYATDMNGKRALSTLLCVLCERVRLGLSMACNSFFGMRSSGSANDERTPRMHCVVNRFENRPGTHCGCSVRVLWTVSSVQVNRWIDCGRFEIGVLSVMPL